MDKEKTGLDEEKPVVRTGSRGAKITQISCLESLETATTSYFSIEINPDKLKAALWEPEINPNPESPEPWGGWMWAFALEGGLQVAITNDRRGGKKWTVWTSSTGSTLDVYEALRQVIAAAGFRAKDYWI